jgi:hypothetical protein
VYVSRIETGAEAPNKEATMTNTNQVRRTTWTGAYTWRAASPCRTLSAEIARAIAIFGLDPLRVTVSRRGAVLRFSYGSACFIVAPGA